MDSELKKLVEQCRDVKNIAYVKILSNMITDRVFAIYDKEQEQQAEIDAEDAAKVNDLYRRLDQHPNN